MRALWVSLLMSCLALPLTSHAATLRCGNNLATEGSSQSEVISKCGSPSFRRTVSIPLNQDALWRRQGYVRPMYKQYEEWTYNFGPNRFVQIVVFENGHLVDVRSGSYGN